MTAEPTAYDPMTGATPGAETGTAGQIIPRAVLAEPPVGAAPQAPAPVTPKTADEMVAAASADPAMDRVVNQFVELQQQAEAKQSIAAWFNSDNTSADLKFAEKTAPPGERETTALPAADLRKIDALLRTVAVGDGLSPAQAALRYFGRVPDPGYAFNMIASDAAHAKRPKGKRGPDVKTRKDIAGEADVDLSPKVRADVALEVGQGWKTGQAAETWIFENLSSEAGALFISLRDGRATATKAGYSNPTYDGHKADSAKGKRAGIGRTVDELTDAELEVRKAKVEADRRAMDEEARVGLGFTPQQWNSMDETTRREHVLDYQDLAALGPRVAPVPFNTLAEAPQTATPKAPGARRRAPRDDALDLDAIRAELEAEAEVAALDLGPLSFSNGAGLMSWPGEAHPRASALLRAGDVRGALGVLARTAGDPTHRKVAQKLLARIGDTRSQVVSPEIMDSIRAELSPETPTLGVGTPPGVYVHPRNETQLAAMRREGHDTAADLLEQYGGQILFNEGAGISPELALHEAFHAVADGVLTNKSHPLTRQLDTLRVELLKVLPATHYGLSNVRELMAEGLNNPVFRRDLGSFNVEGQPYSAWQRWKNIVGNWLRGVIGLQPKKIDTTVDAVDRALDAILAMNPNEMNSGELAGASFSPGGMRKLISDNLNRARVPTKDDINEARAVVEDYALDPRIKKVFADAMQTLNFLGEAAAKYLPSAPRVPELTREHAGRRNQLANEARVAMDPGLEAINRYQDKPETATKFERVHLGMSAANIDARKPRSYYEGYSYRYNVLDGDGNIVSTFESPTYKNETERNAKIRDYNAKLPDNGPKGARARVGRNSDENKLAAWDVFNPMLRSLPKDLQQTLDLLYALPDRQRAKLNAAIKDSLEAMLPGKKAMQQKLYGRIFAKISAEKLVEVYQQLGRLGDFWVTYSAYDPAMGETTLFKHSFLSLNAQQVANRMLRKQNLKYYAAAQAAMGNTLPAEAFEARVQLPKGAAGRIVVPAALSDRITRGTDITPGIPAAFGIETYRDAGKQRARPRAPLEFFAKVIDTIDSSGDLGSLLGTDADRATAIKEKIVELMFDSSPESSFLQSFRARVGRRGFENDISLLEQDIAADDVMSNIVESNLRFARQIADLEYGAKFAGIRTQLEKEYDDMRKGAPPPGVSPAQWMRQQAAAQQYFNNLVDFTKEPFRQNSSFSRSAVASAYTYSLGLNPSTAALSLMSLPIFYQFYVGGIYGYKATAQGLGVATRILADTGRTRQVERIGLDGQVETVTEKLAFHDFSLANEDVTSPRKRFLAALVRVGEANGMFLKSAVHSELLGEQPNFLQQVAGKSAILQHLVERYAKESSMTSIYLLDLRKQLGKEDMSLADFTEALKTENITFTEEQGTAAAKTAVTIAEKVNGPTMAAMRPKWAQSSIGNMIYLFKTHPLSMLNLIHESLVRSFGPATEDRAIARKQFVGMIGSLGAFSGVLGLPMMQQITSLYDLMFTDDDEPDAETRIRTTLGEAGANGLFSFITGTAAGERIGLGSAVYRTAFGSEDQSPLFQLAEGLGGPVLGLGLKLTSGRARDLASEGEILRATEAVMPTALANFFKAYRFATEGVENRRGNLVVEDIGPFHIAAQALGFMPAEYAKQLAMNSLGTRINNAIVTNRTALLRKFNKARVEGDTARMRDIRAEMLEFSRRHPRAAITGETLDDSARSFDQRTARTSHGLAVSPMNQQSIDSILKDFGPSSIFE